MKKTRTLLFAPIVLLNIPLASKLKEDKHDFTASSSPSVSHFVATGETRTLLGLEIAKDISKAETGFIKCQCGYDTESRNYLPIQACVGIMNQLEPDNTLTYTAEAHTSIIGQSLLVGAGLGLNHTPNDSLQFQASYSIDKYPHRYSRLSHSVSFGVIKSL